MRLASVATGAERRPIATLDRAGTLPGRGAYVCRGESLQDPNGECMKLATRKGTLQRAFRRAVEVPVELLESHMKVAQPDTSPAGRNGYASRTGDASVSECLPATVRRVSPGFGGAPRDLIDR